MPGLGLGQLRLELLAERADLLLELRLPLDELRPMRSPQALDFGLRRAQLLGELGRALLLAAERPQLASRIVQLGAGAPQLGLHRVHRVAGVQRFELRRVELLLQFPGALRLALEGLHLLDRHRELGLRSFELGAQAHRLGLDLLELLGSGPRDGVPAREQLARDPIALGGDAVESLLQRARGALRLDRSLFDLATSADRLLADHPLRRLQLVQSGAVLVLQEGHPLLGLLRAGLRAAACLRFLLHPRLWRLDRALRRRVGHPSRDHGNALRRLVRRLGTAATGGPGGEHDEDQGTGQEEHVRPPRSGRTRDVVGRSGQLDGGGAARARGEMEPDGHDQAVVDDAGLRWAR